MDPDAALEMIRSAIADIRATDVIEDDSVREMVEAVEALDAWLSSGGLQPKAWNIALIRLAARHGVNL